MSQSCVFAEGEGDAWYLRNRGQLQDMSDLRFRTDIDFVCSELSSHREAIATALEIGCSNGLKLEHVCRQLGARGKGIDLSRKAVEEGNARVRDGVIELAVGSAGSLPFGDGAFDLVIFGFCLCYLDRSSILQALGEADRVLRSGGFLAITDFDSGVPHRNDYVHRAGVSTYKQDYSVILLATSRYHLAAKKSYSHGRPFFDLGPNERVATWILYKSPETFGAPG